MKNMEPLGGRKKRSSGSRNVIFHQCLREDMTVSVRFTLHSNSKFFQEESKGKLLSFLAEGLRFNSSLCFWDSLSHIPVQGTAPFKWVLPVNVLFSGDSGQELSKDRLPDPRWQRPQRSRTWVKPKDMKLMGMLYSIPSTSSVHLMVVW